MRIADIENLKNKNKKVHFFHLGIYELLKKKLNFRFSKINGKGYYLKFSNGVYLQYSFNKMQHDFKNHIESEFENLEINGEVEKEDFLKAYYKESPLSLQPPLKLYLSEDFELSENNLHLIKMEIDLHYRFGIEKKEMNEFLKQENFTKAIDEFNNFSKKGDLFYKKIAYKVFLAFNYPTSNSDKKQPTYDFWKINASDQSQFLNKKNNSIEQLKLGFTLKRDLKIYEKQKRVVVSI